MAAIVSFIGWHDSGKTTLATTVVRYLKQFGYQVAVIKSTSEKGISFDTPDTDTYRHRQAGADGVMLVAPDQMVLQAPKADLSLTTLAPLLRVLGGKGTRLNVHPRLGTASCATIASPQQMQRHVAIHKTSDRILSGLWRNARKPPSNLCEQAEHHHVLRVRGNI